MVFLKNIKLTGAEKLLLALFFAGFAAQAAIGEEARKSQEQAPSSEVTWEQEEAAAKKRIRGSILTDPEALEIRLKQDRPLMIKMEAAVLGSFLLLVGAVTGLIRLAIRFFRRQRLVEALGSPGPPAWGFREIFRFILLVMVVIQGMILLQWVLTRSGSPEWLDRHVTALGHTVLIDLFVIGGALWFFLRHAAPSPRIQRGHWAALRFSLGAYALFVPVMIGIILTVAAVVRLLGHDPAPQAIFTIYLSETRAPVLAWMLLLVAALGPIAEEIFFRGVFYRWIRTRIGVFKGLLLTALFFALLHTDPIAFFPILGLGLLFGWVYEKTGSLIAPMAVHVFHNTGMLYVASLVKELTSV